jgi:hypothetical protein
MKRQLSVLGAVTATLAIGVGVAFAMGLLNLPPTPVAVTYSPWLGGTSSTLDITLSGVPSGYDVSDGTYVGWCLENDYLEDPPNGELYRLVDSTDDPAHFPSPCENYDKIPWDLVNYLLNHKAVSATAWDVQIALQTVAGTDAGAYAPLPPLAQAMVDDANSNGHGFLPGPGNVVAVAICADGIDVGTPFGLWQDDVIEVPFVPVTATPTATVTATVTATPTATPTPTSTPTPPVCGNGVVEPGETCDPPGSIAGQNGNRCRADCTVCGDGIVQPPESCDDGNSAQCDPVHPQKPVQGDSCNNQCAGLICKDPSTIKITTGNDLFKAHGVLIPMDGGTIDFATNEVSISLTSDQGAIIFETSVPAGEIEERSNGSFRYGKPEARENGGIYKLVVIRTPDGRYKVTVTSYGEIAGADTIMVTHIKVGDREWTVRADWKELGSRWVFLGAIP